MGDFQKIFESVKNDNDDSMGEEEEYQPIDYNKKKLKRSAKKRAKRSFIAGDDEDIEYRPSKKQKKNNASTKIINSMKQKKNYEERSSTKIIASKPKKNQTNKKKRKRKTKSSINMSSTKQLIQQKTTQNSMHCNVPITVQEKYLKEQYKYYQSLLADKEKKKAEKAEVLSTASMLDQAMGSNLKSASSTNIILEPGQCAPSQPINNSFNQTFIKPSTQYLQKRNKRKINTQKGIDINDYFKKTEATHRNKKPLTYQQRMELNQKRALEQLKKSGNVNIGQNASKATKFSIKRKKIMNKRMNSNLNSSKPASIQNNKMDVDSNNDLNESSNISSNNTLNSTMDSLTNCDETMRQSESDKISQNVQRFELARK